MPSSGMLRRVAFVRTDVSVELSASFIRMTRIGDTESVVPSSPIRITLMKQALSSSETSNLTRATRRNITNDAIPHCVELKLYINDFRGYKFREELHLGKRANEAECRYWRLPLRWGYLRVELA
jgi:hypothetical protein